MAALPPHHRAFVTRKLRPRRDTFVRALANSTDFIFLPTVPGPVSDTVPPLDANA